MSAGIEIYNYVTNQKGSPAIYSDTFANRPAAGFIGRLFVSTNTLEIYRDNGTTWDLISGGGGPAVNIYNSDGSLTAARTMTMAGHNLTFEGGASTARLAISANNNIARILSFRTAGLQRWAFRVDGNETGLNNGGDWALRAYDDAGTFTFSPISATRKTGEKILYAQESLTVGTDALAGVFNIAGGTYGAGLTFIGGNAHGAQFNNFTLANGGSFTFAASSFVGANGNVLRLQANATGTVTLTPASPGIRTAAVSLNQIQYNTSGGAALTYTHGSVLQTLGILQLVSSGSLTVTNAYGLIINDLNEYGYPSTGPGALILTNRWGIYQDSTTDVNYLRGTTLIGTTTNAGYKLDVSGTLRNTLGANFATTSGSVLIGSTSLSGKLSVQGANANTYLLIDNVGSGENYYAANAFHQFLTAGSARMTINSSGNVGIGTTTPNKKTVIAATAAIATGDDGLVILDPVSSNQTYLARCGSSFTYLGIPANSGLLYANTDLAIAADSGYRITFHQNSGRVGFFSGANNLIIGTLTDSGQRLQINSSLRLIPTSTVPTASAGTLYYDNATNKLKLYDGTLWVDLN